MTKSSGWLIEIRDIECVLGHESCPYDHVSIFSQGCPSKSAILNLARSENSKAKTTLSSSQILPCCLFFLYLEICYITKHRSQSLSRYKSIHHINEKTIQSLVVVEMRFSHLTDILVCSERHRFANILDPITD